MQRKIATGEIENEIEAMLDRETWRLIVKSPKPTRVCKALE